MSSKDGHDADNTKQSTADMTAFVQNLLQQMLQFLNCVLLDEMGNRIDELEQSINDLRAEMGQEGSPSPSAPLKTREEPKSAEDS
ncbi:UNVERIFIED_CONTAM: Heat shock factor-binding protein [Sesamum radiatum]|uniref:Heat shock factor-binding protein n=1 Tax=Sesamum radiatum TaxID=300843 RepID=A0AAW2SL99_SESRA